MDRRKKLYLIANSHIDPVWIWSRASGQYSWLNTAYAVVQMMHRHPEMKFSCSSSAMYRCIEETAPGLFSEIRELVQAGRWEIVGGWEVQSDAIVSDTESLIRQGLSGRAYFQEKFGVDVKIGYCVDSFGHSAHLPKIFNATGFTHYVFLRPMSHQTTLPLLFDWRSEDGSQVRALRIFDTYDFQNCSKAEFMDRIDQHIANGLPHQTLFFGTGDHGGGVYEKHYEWMHEAAQKYDICYSTLGEYFKAVENEDIPLVENQELGPIFRGCYSASYEVKKRIAECSARLDVAEKAGVSESKLKLQWQELLYHNFHDVMSGTASYQATHEDILPALGGVQATADREVRNALCRRSSSLDTTFLKEGGFYLWNPQNAACRGIVSVPGFTDPNETGSDFNALADRDGNIYPLQIGFQVPTVFSPCAQPWGALTAAIPMSPNGELALAYTRVADLPENLGFQQQYQALKKIQFLRFHDDSGTWGFTLENFSRPEDVAELVRTEEFADGPVFSVLRAFYKINSSEIRLDIRRFAGIDELKLELRIDWHERLSVLKMGYLMTDSQVKFFTGTPGGEICRYRPGYSQMVVQIVNGRREPLYPQTGERAMIEWCACFKGNQATAFYSQDLHGCDFAEGAMRLTVLRTVPYADHLPFMRNDETGYQDMGLQFREAWLLENASATPENLPQKARTRLRNIECAEITGHTKCGDTPPFAVPRVSCSENVVMEAARMTDDGKWELHLLNYGEDETVELPDGRKILLPAKALRIIEFSH